jgi:hypothetical protein
MNVPIEIIAGVLAVLLTAVLQSQRSMRRKLESLERTVIVLIIMLRDRGMKIPDIPGFDTERLLKGST